MSKSTPENRLHDLRECISSVGGDVLEGFRQWRGMPLNEVARTCAINPSTFRQCLRAYYGHKHLATRRAIEVGLGLPPYCLDDLLDQHPNSEE